MFSIFKKKKKQLTIADVIKNSLSQKKLNLQIDLYVDDQILFQVVPAKHYTNNGLTENELNGFLEIHFFNKNKTHTLENQEKANQLSKIGELIYYEEPKENHNYIKPIGNNPEIIEIIIKNRIKEIYPDISPSRISIKY